VFQSRFGREEWLKPYADHRLIALAKDGIKRVDVVCPGFAADCLETLDEINRENRDIFLKAGGEEFHYIPALNYNDEHIEALVEILK
jgi:ferrochelatase